MALAAICGGATMQKCSPQNRCDGSELVRLWALDDGTRCVLASAGNGLELKIVHDGTVVRRAPCFDVRLARDAAQMWRVDYEIEHTAKRSINISRLCPECGEEAMLNGRFPDSARWLGCASCGNVWLDETNGAQRRVR